MYFRNFDVFRPFDVLKFIRSIHYIIHVSLIKTEGGAREKNKNSVIME